MARGQAAGAVRIDIVAQSAQFTKALRESRTRLQRFAARSKSIARGIKSHWRGIAGSIGGATAAIGYGIKRMTDYSSKLVESARATNLATKELENLRELFRGDGIGITQTDKAMKDFTVRIGEAQRGVSTYKKAFEDLGITLHDADGQFKDQQALLTEVAGKLREAGSQAEASAIAYNLFGRSGKDLLPILLKYGENLSDAAEHAGRFRTLTDDQHKLNKELGQTFDDVTANLNDLVQKGLALAAPHVKDIAAEFNRWITDIKDNPAVMSGLQSFVEGLGTALAFVVKTIATVITGFGYMFRVVKTISERVADLFSTSFAEARDAWIDARTRLDEHKARGPLTLPSGRVTTAAQQTFDETTLTLTRQERDARGLFNVKQMAARAKQSEKEVDDLISGMETTFTFEGGTEIKEGVKAATSDGVKEGLMLGLSRSSVKDRRMLQDFSQVVAEEIGATMLATPDLLISRSQRTQDGAASFRRRRLARSLRDGTRDSMRMRHSYYPSMFDQFADDRYPTDLNQTGAYIGFFKEGARITTAVKEGVEEALKVTPGRDFRDRQKAARTRGEYYTPYGLDIGDSRGSSILTALTDGAIITGAPAKSVAEQIARTVYQDNQKAARTRGEFYDRWGPVGPNSSVMGGQKWAAQLLGNRGQYGDRMGRLYGTDTLSRMRDDGLTKPMQENIKVSQEMRAAFDSLGDSIVDNFRNAGEALKQFARELVKIGLQRTIINPIGNALFGSADGSTDGMFGGFFNDVFGGAAAGMGAPIGAGMGARSVTIVNNISSTDGSGVRAALAEATPGIVRQAESTIMDNSNRYGQTQRMIRGTR